MIYLRKIIFSLIAASSLSITQYPARAAVNMTERVAANLQACEGYLRIYTRAVEGPQLGDAKDLLASIRAILAEFNGEAIYQQSEVSRDVEAFYVDILNTDREEFLAATAKIPPECKRDYGLGTGSIPGGLYVQTANTPYSTVQRWMAQVEAEKLDEEGQKLLEKEPPSTIKLIDGLAICQATYMMAQEATSDPSLRSTLDQISGKNSRLLEVFMQRFGTKQKSENFGTNLCII